MREGANSTHWLAKLKGWNGVESVAGYNSSSSSSNGNGGVRAACVNPLSWLNGTATAPKTLHLGGMGVLGPKFLTAMPPGLVSVRCACKC